MRTVSVDEVLERLKLVLGEASDSGLARAIGGTPQTISSWRQRNSIPYSKCVEISQSAGVSLDWLLTGTGNMYKDASGPQGTILTPQEAALLELFKGLSEKDRREICQDAAEKKRLTDLERQVKDLAAQLERLNSAG